MGRKNTNITLTKQDNVNIISNLINSICGLTFFVDLKNAFNNDNSWVENFLDAVLSVDYNTLENFNGFSASFQYKPSFKIDESAALKFLQNGKNIFDKQDTELKSLKEDIVKKIKEAKEKKKN